MKGHLEFLLGFCCQNAVLLPCLKGNDSKEKKVNFVNRQLHVQL